MSNYYSYLFDIQITRNSDTDKEEHQSIRVYAHSAASAALGLHKHLESPGKYPIKEMLMCDGRIMMAVDFMPRPAKSLNW